MSERRPPPIASITAPPCSVIFFAMVACGLLTGGVIWLGRAAGWGWALGAIAILVLIGRFVLRQTRNALFTNIFEQHLLQALDARQRYEHSGEVETLDEAVDLFAGVLQHPWATNAPSDFRSMVLGGLANSLQTRYQTTGQMADLNQAIEHYQTALRPTRQNSSNRATFLNDLGTALYARYLRGGQLADLEQAILNEQEAIRLTPTRSPDRVSYLNNLGLSLLERYERAGNLDDLEEAIRHWQLVVPLTSSDSPDRAGRLNNLGLGLRARYLRTKDPTNLDKAVQCWREAVQTARADSASQAIYLNSLGLGLSDLYDLTAHSADLEEAIAVYQRALQLTPADAPNRAVYLSNLGVALRDRYALTAHLADLDEAITSYQQILQITPSTAPHRPGYLNNLGVWLHERYIASQNAADLEQAMASWRQACELGRNVSLEATLGASRNWGNAALQRKEWREGVEAFQYGLEAAENLLRTHLLRSDKETWLSEVQSLPARTAYAFAKIDQPEQAVETLEAGRTRLLAETLERERQDLANLPLRGHPELYKRYLAIVSHYAQLERQALTEKKQSAVRDAIFNMNLARSELDTVIQTIRQVPGYEDFFRSAEFARLQRILTNHHQAGVYLLTVAQGGLALIVHAGGVEKVWLGLTERAMRDWLVRVDENRVTSGYLPAQSDVRALSAMLVDLQTGMGSAILGPVAAILRNILATDVVLIPTGHLALFPLHAAHYMVDGQLHAFLDEFTVTYASSARVIEYGRAAVARLAETNALFGVSDPKPLPRGVPSLVFAQPEVEEIALLFDRHTVVAETQATRAALRRWLDTTSHLHFSCHGQFNADDPLQSGVLLSNGEWLTVKDLIAGQRLKHTRLAVLSACQTAIIDFHKLPEEAVGLPSGFLQAGVPGVVGTLWPVNDLSTALLMIKFYTYHLQHGLAPAKALRQAQLWLRDVTNAELSELFDFYRQSARPGSRLTYAMAQEKFREHTLRDPDGQPFADPYYWAPFVFYGA